MTTPKCSTCLDRGFIWPDGFVTERTIDCPDCRQARRDMLSSLGVPAEILEAGSEGGSYAGAVQAFEQFTGKPYEKLPAGNSAQGWETDEAPIFELLKQAEAAGPLPKGCGTCGGMDCPECGLQFEAIAAPGDVQIAGPDASLAEVMEVVADRAVAEYAVAEWEIIPNYFCSECGDPARGCPTSRVRWGCAKCHSSTEDLLEHFDRVDPNAPKFKPISEWEIIPAHFCRRCNDPARQNPYVSNSWGCAKCDGESCSLMLDFRSEDEPARPSSAVAEAVVEVIHYFQSNVIQWEVVAALGGQASAELAAEQRKVIGRAELALLPILRQLYAPVCSCLPEELRAVVLAVDAEAEEVRLKSRQARANDLDRRLLDRMELAAKISESVDDLIRSGANYVDPEKLRFISLDAKRLKDLTAEDYERF